MTQELEYEIRYTTEADEPLLREWLKGPTVIKWFPFGEAEVDNVAKNWVAYARFSSSLTLEHQGMTLGIATIFFMPYIKLSHQATFLIVVDPRWQYKGFGNILLRNLVHLAKNYFHIELLGIEIMRGCPLTSALIKNGFKLIYEQDDYFKEGDLLYAREYWEVQLR